MTVLCHECGTNCPKAAAVYKVQLLGTRAYLMRWQISFLGCISETISSPDQLSPDADICLVSGLHTLLPEKYLEIPRLGIWGFHETDLPIGRGCAPLQWTVLNGIKRLTVSMFRLEKCMDSGVIAGQAWDDIEKNDLLPDLRYKADRLINHLIRDNLRPLLHGGILALRKQDTLGVPTRYRKRIPEDSRLDPSKTLYELWDLIRVCDNKSFPAFFEIDGKRIYLKAEK